MNEGMDLESVESVKEGSPLICSSHEWPGSIGSRRRMRPSRGGQYHNTPSECSMCGTR